MAADHRIHIPVLPDEILEALQPAPGKLLVDGTLGAGGHTRLLAERVAPGGQVIAIDRDPTAVADAQREMSALPVTFCHGSYADLPRILAEHRIERVDGILLDLGLSSDQLADSQRGFSFDAEGELDMRFDPTAGQPAWALIDTATESELADLIFRFGEERHSRRVARKIFERRQQQPFRTASDLAHVVRSALPRSSQKIDPATRTFQALRIAVNGELDCLEQALEVMPGLLADHGRLAIISFHSLEDRLVKLAMRRDQRLRVLSKKPIQAGDQERLANPRARSAKLRVAERLPLAESGGFRVVSGGQTGVDRAALDAAMACHLPHGGWCPRGRRAEDGPIPDRYQLQETDSEQYPVRTEQNVLDSDGTLILFRDAMTGGTELTYRLTKKHHRPALCLNLRDKISPQVITEWIAAHRLSVLNVAGPRESTDPGIGLLSRPLLEKVFQHLADEN